MKEFIEQGYEVYSPITDNTLYDMIVSKGGGLYKVEVKSTKSPERRSGAYKVQLKRVRSNKNTNTIHYFDNSSVNILAVYLEDIDKVIIMDSLEVVSKTELTIRV
jgi:Holliday junction resolvase-like predicted endonuclease